MTAAALAELAAKEVAKTTHPWAVRETIARAIRAGIFCERRECADATRQCHSAEAAAEAIEARPAP